MSSLTHSIDSLAPTIQADTSATLPAHSSHCWYCGAQMHVSTPQIEPLPMPPSHCQYCKSPMFATTTPAGEACYECSNRDCQWVAMAAIYAKPGELI